MKRKIYLIITTIASLTIGLLWRFSISEKAGDMYGFNEALPYFFIIVAAYGIMALLSPPKNFFYFIILALGFLIGILLSRELANSLWWQKIVMITAGAGFSWLLWFKRLRS